MRVGVHTSIAGGVENAAHRAKKLGCDTFQRFSANPRGWRAQDRTIRQCEAFRKARAQYGLTPVVVHDNYLINLASADCVIRTMSIASFREEIERATTLGADYLVTDPGGIKGTTPPLAIANCVQALPKPADGLPPNA